MRAIRAILLYILVFLVGLPASGGVWLVHGEPAEPEKPEVEFILFLTADGFRTDYVEMYNPSYIRELIDGGVRVEQAWPVFPTNTTPNMTSLVTGAYPKTTGVANNSQYVPELDQIVSGPRDNESKTIADMLGEAGWRPAAVSHFALDTRGVHGDMYHHIETYSTDLETPDRVADRAVDIILNDEADFLAVNFGSTDTVGHHHGPYSPEIEAMVLAVDAAIGRILGALQDAGLYEKTLITFNSDHGMSEFEDKNASMEPAQALRQAGFEVATSQAELDEDTEIVVLAGGVRLIYFRKSLSEAEQQQVMDALEAIEGIKVMDRERLDELHCHPERSGDLIVHPLPGYTISGAGNPGGLHGRLTEANPVLVFHGPGFRQGVTVEEAHNVDIVPTLLHLVGVPPAETVDGKVIEEALGN